MKTFLSNATEAPTARPPDPQTDPLALTLTCAGACGADFRFPDHLHNVNGRELCGICRAEAERPTHPAF